MRGEESVADEWYLWSPWWLERQDRLAAPGGRTTRSYWETTEDCNLLGWSYIGKCTVWALYTLCISWVSRLDHLFSHCSKCIKPSNIKILILPSAGNLSLAFKMLRLYILHEVLQAGGSRGSPSMKYWNMADFLFMMIGTFLNTSESCQQCTLLKDTILSE